MEPQLSIVTPAFNEASALPALVARLREALEPTNLRYELIIVNDGSTDQTWQIVQQMSLGDPTVRGLRLSRNFGHQLAILAGLSVAEGDVVVTMDSDLQHPPELIPDLLRKYAEGFEVVHAVRRDAAGTNWFKRRSADVFYWLFNHLTSLDLPSGAADFRLMSRRVVNVLLSMPERRPFLRALARWVGFEQTTVAYEPGRRIDGKTTYTFSRMIRLAWDAVVSFSSVPLRLASLLGLIVSALGAIYLVYVLLVAEFSSQVVQGWRSLTAAVLFLGGVQLLFLGVLGQYVSRMYEDVKRRPLFLVAEDTHDSAGPHVVVDPALFGMADPPNV